MFYRRKVILALLEVFGGELDRMHLAEAIKTLPGFEYEVRHI